MVFLSVTSRESARESVVGKAISIFRAHGGVLRTMEAIRLGVHPRTLYAMRDSGVLEKLGRGVYRLSDLPPLENPDLISVSLRIPQGVLCLVSALAFHEITTQIPHEVYIALKRGAEPPRLNHPPVRVFWFSGSAFSEGIETHEMDGIEIRVYGAAKTVTDCFKYRNKLGLDTALEALKFFLRDRKGSPDDLMYFARINRASKAIRPYIEALL